MIPYDKALALVLAEARPLPVETVELAKAQGRVLARPAAAPHDLPPFDNSAMDGYAVHAEDVAGAASDHPVRLPVVGTVYAGEAPPGSLPPGAAMAIMTGARLPDGADAVVVVEDTDRGAETVSLYRQVPAGRHVRPRGGDFRTGDPVLSEDTRLGSVEIGLLAYLGLPRCEVIARPRVAVLCTGDELVAPGGALSGAQVYDCNGPALTAMVEAAGAIPFPLGIGRDDPDALARQVGRGLEADVLVTSGGVSAGQKDYLREVLAASAWREVFYKVAVKPGMPVLFGIAGETPVFSLPGNPVSSMVTCSLFVWPFLRAMQGRAPVPGTWRARAGERWETPGARDTFLRVTMEEDEEIRLVAFLTREAQGSGIYGSMRGAMGLARVPGNVDVVEAGESVEIFPLLGSRLQEGLLRHGG